MTVITREEIYGLNDRLIHSRKNKSKDLVGCFLNLFVGEELLQSEAVYDWHEVEPDGVPAKHIQECFEEALKEEFIEDRNGNFFITDAGKTVADEVVPIEMRMD